MIGVFNTITLNTVEIYRGNDFTLSREFIYAGEVVTCTGKVCADVVGWRYSNVTVSWDNLSQAMLQVLMDMSGDAVELTFSNEMNESVTENVIPILTTATATRFTDDNGNAAWSNVGLELRFIDAHN